MSFPSNQVNAGIGGPRPSMRGLSATVAGLQQPQSSKWAEAFSINRFGEERLKIYLLQKRSGSAIGGGMQ